MHRLSWSHPVLTAATPCWLGCQKPLLMVAARRVSGTHKFNRRLTHLFHCELHWLDVPQHIQFKLRVTVRRCLQGNAPQYLVDCCKPTTGVASRQRLSPLCKSPSAHRATTLSRTKFGRRALSVAGPTAWNSLPDSLRYLSLSEDTFRRSLKTYSFALY